MIERLKLEIKEELLSIHIGKATAEAIVSAVESGIHLETIPSKEDDFMAGESKIGGIPDLPDTFKWPHRDTKPISFIAQLNMRDFSKFDERKTLPQEGILYFFYDAESQPWGFDPKDGGSWMVYYFDGPIESLQKRQPPEQLAEGGLFEPCKISASAIITLPCLNAGRMTPEGIELTKEDADAYYDFLTAYNEKEGVIRNQLLGHPTAIQGDMQLQCQLVTHGLYCGDASGYEDPRAEGLALGASNWKLLLQIDSDDNAGMMWGDMGRIYFWLKKTDLERKIFDDVWVILQCS